MKNTEYVDYRSPVLNKETPKDYMTLLFGIVILILTIYLIPINLRDLWQPDETRYAEISREMLLRGDWVVPHLLDLRYFEKPVGGYWLNNIAMWVFGENNFSVRLASSASTLVTSLIIFSFAKSLWQSTRNALISVVVYLSMFLVFSVGTYSVLDPALTLWLTAAMVAGYQALNLSNSRHKFLAFIIFGLCCGMGFLTKGFLALVVPVIIFIPYVLLNKKFLKLLYYSPVILVSALLISLPWVLAIHAKEPDYWHYFFWVEHIQRFAKEDAQHKAPIWYYIPTLFLAVLPWTGLLIGMLRDIFRKDSHYPAKIFLLCWAIMPFLFFSIAKGKLVTYILPCMPPIALLICAFMLTNQQARNTQENLLIKQQPNNILPTHQRFAVKLNGSINIIFGVIGILLLATSALVAYLVHIQNPTFTQFTANTSAQTLSNLILFDWNERYKTYLGIIAFVGFSLFGWLSLGKNTHAWIRTAGAPILLSLLFGFTLPNKVVYNKQPEPFIETYSQELHNAQYILTDSLGVSSALAWVLKRSDIYLYAAKGELEYGLNYEDSSHRYVSPVDFSDWLASKRQVGNIALVLKIDPDESIPDYLPKADKIYQMNRFSLLIYQKDSAPKE